MLRKEDSRYVNKFLSQIVLLTSLSMTLKRDFLSSFQLHIALFLLSLLNSPSFIIVFPPSTFLIINDNGAAALSSGRYCICVLVWVCSCVLMKFILWANSCFRQSYHEMNKPSSWESNFSCIRMPINVLFQVSIVSCANWKVETNIMSIWI